MAKSDAVWSEIDPQSLAPKAFKAYNEYVEQRKLANELKRVFETTMRDEAEMPSGRKLVFGYNFGKLSVAVVEDDTKPRVAAKPKLSLSDYLKGQR